MDRLQIFKDIAAQASRGELTFPTNVNASLKLQQALDDPNCHIDAAAKLVIADPLLSARTVAIANSAAYNRAGNEITNVKVAVSRLGFRTLKSLVASVIVRQLDSKITDPGLKLKAAQLWEHSAHVSALAQVIARRVTKVDADTAMFAGIVHEVGGFYLLSRAQEFPGLLDGDPEDWVEYGEKLIGRGVLKKLGVPDAVMTAVEALWHGVSTIPPETLGDTLLLANDLARVVSPLHEKENVSLRREAVNINFEIEDGTLQSILQESEEEIESLTAALLV
ncbi:MAG: HDOD domain-containing protein [Undibacterium sp.]|uniref:HDOD domain-containing protein n=1 Tax=Undibacterium sp. TaxID=1914977 RepID=UPI002722B356|nr:HDOD domain-containing protein [Undibacterium sp.]MDO8652264.1 HDOD domain-containing protein [Undibacterium sp.]